MLHKDNEDIINATTLQQEIFKINIKPRKHFLFL